jgi:hypothetical protein
MQAASKIPVFLAGKDCFIDNLTYKTEASFSVWPPGAPDIGFYGGFEIPFRISQRYISLPYGTYQLETLTAGCLVCSSLHACRLKISRYDVSSFYQAFCVFIACSTT